MATLAGTAGTIGSTDGVGTTASFNSPSGIAIDGSNLYVSDTDNGTIRTIGIRSVEVTTLAGTAEASGATDGIGAAAIFDRPNGITSDEDNLFISDQDNETIRKIVKATGEVATIAGVAGESGSTDGIGTAARFYWPAGITTDGMNLYVTDMSNSTIRKIQ